MANTLFALLDQDRQIRRFVSVAQHLEVGGRFLTETLYPDLGRFDRGQRLGTVALGVDEIRLAGLELEQRWGGWRREPFTGDSKGHIRSTPPWGPAVQKWRPEPWSGAGGGATSTAF